MIISKKSIVKWNPINKKYYVDKGYTFSKMGDPFEVSIDDLYQGSSSLVDIKCDFCGDFFLKPFHRVSYQEKHCCEKCKHRKYEDTCMKKYGVKNTFQDKGIKEKIKLTNLEKYGVENPYQIEEIRNKVKNNNLINYGVEYAFLSEKTKQTNIERYGVANPMQSEKIKEKARETNLNKYNVEYPMQSEEIKNKTKVNNLKKYGVTNPAKLPEIQNKIKLTNLKKYGVDHIMKDENIRKSIIEKSLKTMYVNRTGPSSTQQRYICSLVNGELNYPIGKCLLDVAFPNEMIYIEYNGGGHYAWPKFNGLTDKDIDKKEMNRYSFLKQQNWKLIRIVCKSDKLYDDEKIIQLIDECRNYLKLGNNWIEINIDKNMLYSKDFKKEIK